MKHKILTTILAILLLVAFAINIPKNVHADSEMTVSPMYQKTVLVPGQTKHITFILANPSNSGQDLEYELELKPFSVDNENSVSFTAKEDFSQIVDWITIDHTEGILKPNGRREIALTVEVPENAPAGGQYAAIIVRAKNDVKEGQFINSIYEMAHLIYAEVAGETIHQGGIERMDVPSFLFSGDITGGVSVKNSGNVHAQVKQILKVYPLVGSEELFTNEESPQENLVMPDATRYTNIAWEQTPSIGIFRVNYIAEFEGVKNELEKIVIICPLWLLIVILLLIAIIVFRIITSSKSSKKAKKETPIEA
jgi:hypothetical protein